MLFFFLMGLWYGYAGNLYVPAECGRMDLSFTRCNSISVWLFYIAMLALSNAARGMGRDKLPIGWTMYPPLSTF